MFATRTKSPNILCQTRLYDILRQSAVSIYRIQNQRLVAGELDLINHTNLDKSIERALKKLIVKYNDLIVARFPNDTDHTSVVYFKMIEEVEKEIERVNDTLGTIRDEVDKFIGIVSGFTEKYKLSIYDFDLILKLFSFTNHIDPTEKNFFIQKLSSLQIIHIDDLIGALNVLIDFYRDSYIYAILLNGQVDILDSTYVDEYWTKSGIHRYFNHTENLQRPSNRIREIMADAIVQNCREQRRLENMSIQAQWNRFSRATAFDSEFFSTYIEQGISPHIITQLIDDIFQHIYQPMYDAIYEQTDLSLTGVRLSRDLYNSEVSVDNTNQHYSVLNYYETVVRELI